jgi:ferredoxin--NADP+ reductase
MPDLGTDDRPLRVAIVGSGPSGFYAAEALFRSEAKVDMTMFDRLPTPFGLVRGGVAPDHAKIKNVIKVYERIATAPEFGFVGNVMIGRDITVDELRPFFDAILFANGAETDNQLGIPGEDLLGSHTATAFVGWYNGHPDYRDFEFDLSQEVAVVIGQGNVAMDVSRILGKTVDELRETDIAEHALDALAESKVKEIHLIGRRGAVQTKFSTPEIREIGVLEDCHPIVNPSDLDLNPVDQQELDDPDNQAAQKNFAVLQEFAQRGPSDKSRQYHIHFFKSPIELQGDGRLQRVILERNILEGEPFKQRAKGTGETETLDCGLLFRSVGYRGVAIPGVPFEERWGTFPHDNGRITDDGAAVPGLYVAGWIKRGPSGVIGTNKPCSVETVQSLLEDLPKLTPCATPDTAPVLELLKSKDVRAISFADWQRINSAEIDRGKAKGKPREKFTRIEEMIAALD